MTTPVSNIPISADYTSRDYYALREELILRLQNRVPEWTGNDPADFGVALVEAFAYMGDIVNYYIDRVANENFIMTATQRQSILELAATLGYTPTGYRAAIIDTQFVSSSDSDITLPSGTQFLIDVLCEDEIKQLFFSTQYDVTIPALSTATVTSINGEWAHSRVENAALDNNDISAEWVGTSTGLPNQVFQLMENQVVEGTVSVYVRNGDVYEQWTQVANITDSNPNDAVFYTTTDGDNFVYINFGDGISGAIPPNGETVKVDYLIGGGVLGNIPAGVINEVYFSPGLAAADVADVSASLAITNSQGFGGAEPESNDNIRYAAPKFFTAQNRAVTLADFANLALGVSQVGKANAVASSPNSITIFVGPDPDPLDTFQFPGYNGDPTDGGVVSLPWLDLKTSVLDYLAGKTQIGTTVTVAPPAYPKGSISIQYTKLPQYTYDQVETSIKTAIITKYGYGESSFGEIIYPEDIEYLLKSIDGVASAQVKLLYRVGDSAARDILVANPNEIFVFTEEEINLDAADALSLIQLSVGTLSPTFNTSVTNYAVALPNGTTTITVTPTAVASTSTIKVAGVTVASGVASSSIATPVGVKTIDVAVTAEDGVTVTTYRVTLTRAS
jgi:hypothetical protein